MKNPFTIFLKKDTTMKTTITTTRNLLAAALVWGGALASTPAHAQPADSPYKFERGYPAGDTTQRAYDASDLRRAIEAYKFFYPTMAIEASMQQMLAAGAKPNEVSIKWLTAPRHQVTTANIDTPYSFPTLDLKAGPMVIELPPGPFIALVDDHNCRWVMDMGLPGPDKGQGGKHLVLPPDYKGDVPEGYFVGRSKTWKVELFLRAMPTEGNAAKAFQALDTVKIYPLAKAGQPVTHHFIDVSDKAMPLPLLAWENKIDYWQQLHAVIQAETAPAEFRPMLGMLAQLGIEKGKAFNPDARTKRILEEAARTAIDEMRVYAYAYPNPERFVWKDRKWEWVPQRQTSAETKDWGVPAFLDLEASDNWFFQAFGASPAAGGRQVGAGSLYLADFRDGSGANLDGGKTYKLTVPGPVPGKLFWSATIYDVDTRCLIVTDQNKPALSSLYEKFQVNPDKSIDLYFGPKAPAGKEGQWIKTIPGQGWFTYVRIYGPEAPVFDGTWKLNDIAEVK